LPAAHDRVRELPSAVFTNLEKIVIVTSQD
jgi:hypothetical protein